MLQHKAIFEGVFREFGIAPGEPQAYFLAQIDHESRGLRSLTESFNYSFEGLLKTFNRSRISEADARAYGRIKGVQLANQQMIANILYGGEWGRKNLGNTKPDDGWRYRGRGPIQCTGRANYTNYTESLRGTPFFIDFVADPDLMAKVEYGLYFAGWFWKQRNISALIDDPKATFEEKVAAVRKRVNGGSLHLYECQLLTKEYLDPDHEFWKAAA